DFHHVPLHAALPILAPMIPMTIASSLHIEQELDDVPVLHDVFLALGVLQALGLDGGIVEAVGLQVGVVDDAGPDEAALKIAVDLDRKSTRLNSSHVS